MLQTSPEWADGRRKMRVKMACLGVRTGERQQSRTQLVAGDGRIYTVLSQRSFHKFPQWQNCCSRSGIWDPDSRDPN